MACRTYQQWLTNQELKDQEVAKARLIEKEVAASRQERRRTDVIRAQTNYTSWKRRKDMEIQLKKENESELMSDHGKVHVDSTPTLPGGYCSVWACDDQLADHVLARVPRQQELPIMD